jgi:hypothetical protein
MGSRRWGLKRLIALIDPEHEASIGTAMKAGLSAEKTTELDGVLSIVFAVKLPSIAWKTSWAKPS